MSKSRFDFSHAELHALIRSLEHTGDTGVLKINETFQRKYLKRSPDPNLLSAVSLDHFPLSGQGDADVIKAIIKALSILSGFPESSIKPSTEISELNLSETKLDMLRMHLNKIIRDNGGSGTISPSAMGSAVTVQDLIDLVLSKLP
jgi:hypothetical protein